MPFSALKVGSFFIQDVFSLVQVLFPLLKNCCWREKKSFGCVRGVVGPAAGRGQELKGYLLGVWLDHDVTIDENGTNDGKREEWMGEDMYGDPSDRMERREEE